MINLKNADRLALHTVANFNCGANKCSDCPYHARISSEFINGTIGCISIYLKQVADKYYTERIDK